MPIAEAQPKSKSNKRNWLLLMIVALILLLLLLLCLIARSIRRDISQVDPPQPQILWVTITPHHSSNQPEAETPPAVLTLPLISSPTFLPTAAEISTPVLPTPNPGLSFDPRQATSQAINNAWATAGAGQSQSYLEWARNQATELQRQLAATLTAQPTATPLHPTSTPTPISLPTDTPTVTLTATSTPLPAPTPTPTPTVTPSATFPPL
jgi:hypothetical protein